MTEFTVYPAIDLRGGRVVRLVQGRAENEIVYGEDAAATARQWAEAGAAWLHVVDLDRALGAEPSPNAAALERMLEAVSLPVQFGGGLRDMETMRRALNLGVARIVLGTVAVEQREIVGEAVRAFGAERIVIAVDARDGIVATRGWLGTSGIDTVEFGKRMVGQGAVRALLTDIARDGMLKGIDAAAMARYARETGLQVIASGGAAGVGDIRALAQVADAGVEGVIVGQALYTGAMTLGEALRAAREHS